MAQTFKIATAMIILFGVSVIIISNVGTASAQETVAEAKKKIQEAMKSLDSGDNDAARGHMGDAEELIERQYIIFEEDMNEAFDALQRDDPDVQKAKSELDEVYATLLRLSK